jgi:hypothetical protein
MKKEEAEVSTYNTQSVQNVIRYQTHYTHLGREHVVCIVYYSLKCRYSELS